MFVVCYLLYCYICFGCFVQLFCLAQFGGTTASIFIQKFTDILSTFNMSVMFVPWDSSLAITRLSYESVMQMCRLRTVCK